MLKNRVYRTFLWSFIYYALVIFCIFYLEKKVEIKNWDVIWVFVPLVFIACSSESFSKKQIENNKALQPYNYIDFSAKGLAYIFSQLIYRHIAQDIFFWLCFVIILCLLICSIICDILMISSYKKQ